jgi:hypothetical protein
MEFAEKYEVWAKKRCNVCSIVLLTLPHLLSSLILYLFVRNYFFPIFIIGVLIPDYALFEFYGLKLLGIKEKLKDELKRKLVAHYLTFILSVFLLFTGRWEIALAGFIHLIIDYIGF